MNGEKKKKTYIFGQETIGLINELKQMTNKSETQILSEAVELFYDYLKKNKSIHSNFEMLLDKVVELSFRLGELEQQMQNLK